MRMYRKNLVCCMKETCAPFIVAALTALLFVSIAGINKAAAQVGKGTILPVEKSNNLMIEANKGVLVRMEQPISDIFIADPSVADIQVKSPRLVYIFGKKTGETNVYAMDDKDELVYSANLVITQNIVEIQKAIDTLMPHTNVTVKGINGMIVLDGYVKSPEEAAMIERMVKAVVKDGPELMSRLTITTPTQINLRVKIAEVNRDIVKELGFNWQNALSGSGVLFGVATGAAPFQLETDPVTGLTNKVYQLRNIGTNSLFGSVATGGLDLNAVIDALEGEGHLSVLAEPNLTAISGKPASFLAGGEFPVPVPERGDVGIEYKQFGVGLNFTPTVMNEQKITLQVAPEVSQLSNAGAIRIQGISVPSVSTRRASTTVELGSGQSFAIAGLIQNSITNDTSKFPGLGDIPILGALFRSERFRKQETELVIVVTPYIVRPVDERQIVLPTDGSKNPTDMERYLSGKGLSQETRPSAPQSLTKGVGGKVSLGQAGFRIGQ